MRLDGSVQALKDFYNNNFCIQGDLKSLEGFGKLCETACYAGPRICNMPLTGINEQTGRSIRNVKKNCFEYIKDGLILLDLITSSGISLDDFKNAPDEKKLEIIFNAIQKQAECKKCDNNIPIFIDETGNPVKLEQKDFQDFLNVIRNGGQRELMSLEDQKKYNLVKRLICYVNFIGQSTGLGGVGDDINRLMNNGDLNGDLKKRDKGFSASTGKKTFKKNIFGGISVNTERVLPYSPFTNDEAEKINAALSINPLDIALFVAVSYGTVMCGGIATGALVAGKYTTSGLIIARFAGTALAFEGISITSREIFGTDVFGKLFGVGAFACQPFLEFYIGRTKSGKLGFGQRVELSSAETLEAKSRMIGTQIARSFPPEYTMSVDAVPGQKAYKITMKNPRGQIVFENVVALDEAGLDSVLNNKRSRTAEMEKLQENAQCRGTCEETNAVENPYKNIVRKPLEEVFAMSDANRRIEAERIFTKVYLDSPSKIPGKTNWDIILEAHKPDPVTGCARTISEKARILAEGLTAPTKELRIIILRELIKRGIAGDTKINEAVAKIKNILKGKGLKDKEIEFLEQLFRDELQEEILNLMEKDLICKTTPKESRKSIFEDPSGRVLSLEYIVERLPNGDFKISLKHKGLDWIFEGTPEYLRFLKKLSPSEKTAFEDAIESFRIQLNAGRKNPDGVTMGSPDGGEYYFIRFNDDTNLLFNKDPSTGKYIFKGISKVNERISELIKIKKPSEKNILTPIQKFLEKIRGNPGGDSLADAEKFIIQAVPRLNNGEVFRNIHLVPYNGVQYTILDANEINTGGRGNWRYVYLRNSLGQFEFKGIAEHLPSGGYVWYFY